MTTNAGSYLETNPSVRNLTTGSMSLLVKYSYGTNGAELPTPVYLKAETNPQTNIAAWTTVQIKFVSSTKSLLPYFESNPEPIIIAVNFYTKSGFEKVNYSLPEAKDPLGV